MNRGDVVRLLAALDSSSFPATHPYRLDLEAELIALRGDAEARERDANARDRALRVN